MGRISGPIIVDAGEASCDLHHEVWTGPKTGQTKPLTIIQHKAKKLLLVEKLNIFKQLVEWQFPLRSNCILLTGDGYPGTSFHRLIQVLYEQLRLPFYVLADNDPAGYGLFFLMARHGIVGARYLGLRAEDFESLKLDPSVRIQLDKREIEELKRLNSKEWVKKNRAWKNELGRMGENGFKLEMEALISISQGYLAHTYLPVRLQSGDYLCLSDQIE